MAQMLVRNLDESVVKKLKRRAKQNNRSLQAEVKTILEREANSLGTVDIATALKLTDQFREQLKGRKE